MLGFFRGKGKRKENKNENIIYTPCKGTVVPITEVPDPVFSEKVLGDGFAVIPAEGKIYAPTDGEVTLVFDTLHAVGMTSSMGTEILIHIGLDTVALGFRAGFSFSAGAMDLIFSSSLPAAQKTWLILPLGIAAFIVFYVVFLFAIKKFDLKTPGREDDDIEAEKKVELESNDYTAIAAKILEGCGGKENITSIDNCVTRLRLEVKDITAVNDKVIKSAGVAGVIKPGKTSVQVIIGTKVQFVADEFTKLCE